MASESIAFASGASPQPPPLPPRRVQPITSTDDSDDHDIASQGGADNDEDELSEQRLRELYDDEEIERFLNLFSACVTEVRLPELPTHGNLGEIIHGPESYISEDDAVSAEDDDWVPLHGSSDAPRYNNLVSPSSSLSEEIALRYVTPLLPPPPLPPPAFTLGRLRLTIQRLYLVIEPVYTPLFVHLGKLAMWEDKRQSSIYCTVFWILWYKNLLLPTFFLRTLYSLVRYKVFPYPTVTELREHRREIERAKEFGDEVQARLSVSPAFGMKEIWRLFKIFNRSNKSKTKGKGVMLPKTDEKTEVLMEGYKGATVLDDAKENKEEKDVKRTILHCLSEIADLHERVKNIFIWRRPASSHMYGTVLFLLFLVTLLLPARYLAKLTYFIGGTFFWHLTPIIAALPPADRARLPPPFMDAPTDADYAVELISRRVASGLPVNPTRRKTSNKKHNGTCVSDDLNQCPISKGQSIDWKKWGARAAIGKELADGGKQLITGQRPLPMISHRLGAGPQSEATHTFPAHYNAGPGLINVTPTTFSYTPMMSIAAKITIPLQDLRGVKKTGLFKGISIRWQETGEDGSKVENEEKFRWVGSRDELFAILIGGDGKRWMKA